MESRLEIFFGKASIYICTFLFLLSTVLGVGWHISNTKLSAQTEKAQKVEAQLQISNASYRSISSEFIRLTDQLKANQEKSMQNQVEMQTRLASIIENDKSLVTLQRNLLARPTQTDCKMPKDLIDAWSKM